MHWRTNVEQQVINVKNTDQIKCSNCNKNLLFVHSHEKGESLLYKLCVMCPFCNDKSFDFNVYGPMKYVPAQNVQITKFDSKNDKCVFVTRKG